MTELHSREEAEPTGVNDGPWVIFAIDGSWIAVEMIHVSGAFDSSKIRLIAAENGQGYRQKGKKGVILGCNAELRRAKLVRRAMILWFESADGPFGVFCDAAEDVAAGALVSTHDLPPILVEQDQLLLGLLVPDKRRVATIVDVDVLMKSLSKKGGGKGRG
jgi:hypothetical protein